VDEFLMPASTKSLLRLPEELRGVRSPYARVIADSLDLGWHSMQAAITQYKPLPEAVRGLDHSPFVLLIYHLSGPTILTRKIDGGPEDSGLVGPRQICLTPEDATAYWKHSDYPEILQVFLDATIYKSAVKEIFDCDDSCAQLVPQFGVVDPLLEQLSLAVSASMRGEVSEPLYIDAIARLMAAHLAQRYSARSSSIRTLPPPAICRRKLQRVIDFIEENLGANLSLETMAAEAEISALYFARTFRAAIGRSPHQYVIARRLERAKELLRNTDMPLEDVASLVGFSSQSHLSHCFMQHVGITPGRYRQQ
jgi:AraC family transcriptional regulator